MSDDVSRETESLTTASGSSDLPSPPEVAGRVFSSDRLPLATAYAELLASDGVLRGLIGPREAPRLWDRHILNSAVLAEAIPRQGSGKGSARGHQASASRDALAAEDVSTAAGPTTVCDIGSGAGLPGLVLAIARPDLSVTLVEPLLRRTTFLEEVVAALELDNVEVVRARAEELHGERCFDVVTSRAVAPLERLLRWSMPLVAPSGALVAMKGRSIDDEIATAQKVLRKLGCAAPSVTVVGEGVVDPPTRVVRVVWADPGRVGLPTAASSPSGRRGRRERSS